MHETHILETKNVGLYTWKGGGSEKVYCLYTNENVDIFGWHLSEVCEMLTWPTGQVRRALMVCSMSCDGKKKLSQGDDDLHGCQGKNS